MTNYTNPAVYVGTYAKYNNGSIQGSWLKLEDYADRDAFYAACRKIHSDESDPELMFQDFEGFPKSYYSESDVSESLMEWVYLDLDDRAMMAAYQEATGYKDVTLEQVQDAFYGRYDRDLDFAIEFASDAVFNRMDPETLAIVDRFFDYESYLKDLTCGNFFIEYHDGEYWVFCNQ
tara:strand:+ start:60 stop:587 length:528 start_codon:yes stop_codon:yes gene_type:complete